MPGSLEFNLWIVIIIAAVIVIIAVIIVSVVIVVSVVVVAVIAAVIVAVLDGLNDHIDRNAEDSDQNYQNENVACGYGLAIDVLNRVNNYYHGDTRLLRKLTEGVVYRLLGQWERGAVCKMRLGSMHRILLLAEG